MTAAPTKLDFQAVFEAVPGACLVVLPDVPRYTIVAVNDAYARATMTNREQILGRGLFDVFPGNPAEATATGVKNLSASLGQVLAKRMPDAMEVQEIRRPAGTDGAFENRWWSPWNSPVLGPGGEVAYIIHAVEDVTEKRHLEEDNQRLAAAERERMLASEREVLTRGLFDHASDSIFIADTDGNFTEVNAAACDMLGYSREELIDKNVTDVIPFQDVSRVASLREYLLSSGATHVGEWTHIKKDGTRIPVETSTKILPDGRWEAIVRDISERKRIEAEIRDANAFLDAIIENIPLIVFIKESATLRYLRFNRAGERILGWPRRALIGKSDFVLWPREQAEFFVAKDREAINARGEIVIDEEPIQTRHQGVRIMHTKKVPILDAAGRPQYLLGISEDVTEQKRLEHERRLLTDAVVALSASLDYDQTLATVTKLAVQHVADWCGIDLVEEDDGHLRRLKVASADPADAALCEALERLPPDRDLPHLPLTILENKRPIVVERVTPQYLESIAQGQEHLEALRATGITSGIGVPLVSHGKALGVMLFAASNNRRVYGQDDLRWAEPLADRAAVAIENARLYRASVEALELRDQVLGVVAHDLRNPLSTILMLETALRERHGAEHELDVLRRAATRMSSLVQDLLAVSLVEKGQLPIHEARLSPTDLVVEGVESHRTVVASSVELRIDVGSDIPEVCGDRDRLLQVLDNLIGNAIKFTAPGGHITVGATSRDHEVVFWVADDGCGIAPEALPRVFERFWQAKRGDHRGGGLGLPIVKGIVEAHGGHVWVRSTLGRGSTFYFTIPSADRTADRSAARIH